MISIADVLPKLKMFLFWSIISLLINFSICAVAFAQDSTKTLESGEHETDLQKQSESVNATAGSIGKLAIATGTSFVPFFDLINIVTLKLYEIPLALIIYSIIVGIIGAIKLFILIAVIANFIPFMNT